MNGPQRTLAVRASVAVATTLLLTTWVVGCGSESDADHAAPTVNPASASTTTTAAATPNRLKVDLVDYGFDSPDSIPAGVTTISMHDVGKEQHELQLAKLNDGITWDKVEEVLHGPAPDAVSSLVTMAGGVGPVEAGGTGSVTVDLKPGSYALLCFITGFDGTSHLAHGMAKPIEVTARGATSSAAVPKAKGDIVLDEMTVTLPDDFDGTGTWRVVNKGDTVHNVGIMKLAAGATRRDLDTYLSSTTAPTGPPPATVVGGGGALAPGGEEWIDFDLASADYAFLCFVPDIDKGFMPHFMEGMITDYRQT